MANRDKKTAFKARVRHWADKMGVKVAWLGVRPMHRKWASCSTNGHLNFSTDLLVLDRDVRDYVIVHELLHFSVPNHGKLWKSLMRAHLGDYEGAEAKLKQSGIPRRRRKRGNPSGLPEPEALRRGKEVHSRIQSEWEQEAEGDVQAEARVKKPSGNPGRIDIFVDAGDVKALVEIKSTDWDAMNAAAVRRNVESQIRQVWDYIDSQPNDGAGVCPGIVFSNRPGNAKRKEYIEHAFLEEGIPVVWEGE